MEKELRITSCEIINFRGLKNINFQTEKKINVIVGPNAVGKSTILEAFRLAKCLLAPRNGNETSQVLVSLGALSPHFPTLGLNGFDFSALANDPKRDLHINFDVVLSDDEILQIKNNKDQISTGVLLGRLAKPDMQMFEMTQYLSTKEGNEFFQLARIELDNHLKTYEAGKPIALKLKISHNSNQMQGQNIFDQQAMAFLDRQLPTYLTKMSYFPADRSFPQGEVAIQLGSGDAQAQLISHITAPAAKYGRIKISIAQSMMFQQAGQQNVDAEIRAVFLDLVPGKAFERILSNQLGVLKIIIKDINTNAAFDIDNLSSGEKGLIAIFLLARLSLAPSSILLLDEPELHLNPAVTKRLLNLLKSRIVDHHDSQIFLCTHSAEILGDAFESEDCALFHLRSGSDISPIHRADAFEVREALNRLGVSTADVLFSKGNIFVEGPHDGDVLLEGFDDILAGYKISPLGGRNEVEKSIKSLEEAAAQDGKIKLFLFDRDRKPTEMQSQKSEVVIRQWERYCLENYLLDDKPLFDVVLETGAVRPESRGAFVQDLKEVALAQTERVAITRIYGRLEPENAGLRIKEIKGCSIADTAEILADRLGRIQSELSGFDKAKWKAEFECSVVQLRDELRTEWESSWKIEADGKALIDALYERYKIRLDKLSFKRRVMRAMRVDKSETWRAVLGILSDAFSQK